MNRPGRDMQDDIAQDSLDLAAQRRLSRRERQARVGILLNPRDPPRPPPRRAALMGRWPSLRSSRRPRHDSVEEAANAVVSQLRRGETDTGGALPVRRGADGAVQAIDVARLMASVEGVGAGTPVRTPYGSSMRATGMEPEPPVRQPAVPAILTAEAWITEEDDPEEDRDALGMALRSTRPQPVPRPRRRGWRIVGLGVMLALGVLILLPAWSFLWRA
ncbi:MAG: hypothetical protein KDK12_16655 [Rhodobacteraceae bacterium]|nr:hypothetical protein [Paracoccaceae bacterium]